MLKKHRLTVTPTFNVGIVRNGPEWFVGKDIPFGQATVQVAWFGDYKRDIRAEWRSETKHLTTPEKKDVDTAIAAILAEERVARGKEQIRVAGIVVAPLWDSATDLASHPYVERKQLTGLFGTRVVVNEHGHPVLLVPMRDVDGTLWNIQRIYSEKLSKGDKFFTPGALIEGCFHIMGDHPLGHALTIEVGDTIWIAEGFATAASIFMALGGGTVISAFNAGNIEPVALALHKLYPDNPIVICCDNDRFTKAPNGKKWNVGWEKGNKAAQAVDGTVRIPAFVDSSNKQATDFNDLHCLEGLEQVKEQLLHPPTDTQVQAATDKQCLEAQLTAAILDTYGDTLIKQDRDVFAFNIERGDWTHYPPKQAMDHFIKQIDMLSGGKLEHRKLKGAYEHLMVYIPHVPDGHNMFAPSPHVVNFKNGALALERKSDGSYETTFRDKRQSDLLCYSHPFEYTPDAPPNADFEQALKRVLDDAPAIQAYYELLGACLLPAFPKLVLFIGKPGTGKSTLILFAWHLVDAKLRCAVDPTDWKGFGMETMAGKLVNIDPDIKLTKPLEDSILKKVEDRIPVRIQRKGVTDIYAPLPAVHLFGANRLPMTADGVEAYKRRALIFRCDKFQVAETGFVREFANVVWESNPQGIIAAAIKGLLSLAKNGGHFTPFEASKRELEQWSEDTLDLAGQFIVEFQAGTCEMPDANTLLIGSLNGRIKRSALYKCFVSWVEANAPRTVPMSARDFHTRLSELGFVKKMINGHAHFSGFSVKETPNSLV